MTWPAAGRLWGAGMNMTAISAAKATRRPARLTAPPFPVFAADAVGGKLTSDFMRVPFLDDRTEQCAHNRRDAHGQRAPEGDPEGTRQQRGVADPGSQYTQHSQKQQ